MHKCNDQERPQTARRNLTHQQSVEGEVQLRFSSQAFEVPMPLTLKYIQLVRVLLLNILHYELYELWFRRRTLRIIKYQTKHKCNDQECPQTARRNLTHQQSVEGEVQLRFSSQAFEVPMPLTLKYIQLVRVLLLNILHYELYELWFRRRTLRIIKYQTKHKCNDQECPQTARRNLTHQQSVEGEVQLRFSSQAFQSLSNSSKQNVDRCTTLHLPPSSPLMFFLIQSFKCIPSRSQVDLLTKIMFKMWCSVIFRIIRKTALSLVLIPFSYEILFAVCTISDCLHCCEPLHWVPLAASERYTQCYESLTILGWGVVISILRLFSFCVHTWWYTVQSNLV